MLIMHAICRGPHSVTQGSFANPCVYLAGGFDSGLQNSKEFSITITNDQERKQTIFLISPCRQVTRPYDSHLLLLQKYDPLWSRNDWVSASFQSRSHLGFVVYGRRFCSAINAPTTGSNTYAAFLAAAKALGSSEVPVRFSLIP